MKIYHVISNSLEYFNDAIVLDKKILSNDEGHIPRLIKWLVSVDKINQHILVIPSSSLKNSDQKCFEHKWGFKIYLVKSFLIQYPVEFSLDMIFFLRSLDTRTSIIHFHGVTSPIYSTCVFFLRGRKIIANYRGGWFELGKSFFRNLSMILGFKFIIPFSLKKASIIISESKKMYEHYVLKFPKKSIFYIPGGTPVYNGNQRNFAKKNIKILFVGQLIARKGVTDLLKAFVAIKKHNIKLCIIGSGPLKNEVLKYAQENNRIEYIPYVLNSHLDNFYESADIFVLPTYNDSCAWVLLEAMSHSLPVISTKTEGPLCIIKDGVNGILINPGSPEDLKKSMEKLINSVFLRRKIGSAAKERIISHFSSEYIARKFIDSYDLLSGN